jgi:CBS domain-containing protein
MEVYMQVREIMTRNPACCAPDSTLQEVARMMQENDCGCIPVVDSLTEMKPVGTITDRDITIRTLAANQNPMNMIASNIMTSDIATVTPQTSVEECFDVMEDREIRRVLVVDEQGRCCGIVAQADVVQSGVNPIRTNKVIREISESAPTHNQRISMGTGRQKSHANNQSFINNNSLLPLLIGLGSGAALTYLLNTRRKSTYRESTGNLNTDSYQSDYLDTANQANLGKYADAEQEVEKRRHHLKERVEALRTEPDSPLNESAESFNQEDETITNNEEKRTAHQGEL